MVALEAVVQVLGSAVLGSSGIAPSFFSSVIASP